MAWAKGRRQSAAHTQAIRDAKFRRVTETELQRTITERRVPLDHVKQHLLDALRASTPLVVNAWVDKMLGLPGVDYIQVEKRHKGEFVPVARLTPGDVAAESGGWEHEIFFAGWGGAAVYHLSLVHHGEALRPPQLFKIGGVEAITRSEAGLDDADLSMGRMFKRMELMNGTKVLRAMETKFGLDVGSSEGGDMKPEEFRAVLESVRLMAPLPAADTMAPLLMQMWKASEERNAQLLASLLERRDRPDPAATIIPSIVDGLRTLGPRVLGPAMSTIVERFFPSAPVPDGGWSVEKVLGLMQAAGPTLQPLLQPLLDALGRLVVPPAPTSTAGTLVASGVLPAPSASNPAFPTQEESPMPPKLTPEQEAALRAQAQVVALIRGYLLAEDYDNAWEMLDTAPGFMEWTARLSPQRPAAVYTPVLMSVFGLELAAATRAVEAFYQLLLAEDEAVRRAGPPVSASAADAEGAAEE